MICPACKTSGTDVVQTMDCDVFINRRRRCRCGCRWTTEERLIVDTLVLPNSWPSHVQSAPEPVKTPTENPSLSSSDPISSLVLVASDPERARVSAKKGRGDAAPYPAEFEELWAGCTGAKGNKHPAFKVWLKVKPNKLLTIEMWNRWMLTDGWQRGFSKHMSTWLNARGWQDEPPAAPKRSAGNSKSAGNIDNLREWYDEGIAK